MSADDDTPPERIEELLDFAQEAAVHVSEGMFGRPYLMPGEVLSVLSLVCQDVCYRRAYCLSKSDDRRDKEFKGHLVSGLVWLSRELGVLAQAHADGTVERAGAADDAKKALEKIVRLASRKGKARGPRS